MTDLLREGGRFTLEYAPKYASITFLMEYARFPYLKWRTFGWSPNRLLKEQGADGSYSDILSDLEGVRAVELRTNGKGMARPHRLTSESLSVLQGSGTACFGSRPVTPLANQSRLSNPTHVVKRHFAQAWPSFGHCKTKARER